MALPAVISRPPLTVSQDLSLPKTMVQRLAKGVLPANTQIQKDALLAISKSATVFVNYLSTQYVPFPSHSQPNSPNNTSILKIPNHVHPSANESALRASKKTIQPKDVLAALDELEFAGFIPRCEGELAKFQAVQCDKRNNYRRKVREEAKAKQAADLANGVVEQIPGPPVATIPTFSVRNRDLPPAAKKMRALQEMGAGGEGGVAVDVDGEEMFEDEGDVDMNDEAVQEEDVPDEEDINEIEEQEDQLAEYEEEIEEDPNNRLVEDPLERREHGEDEDEDEGLDGDESD